MKKPLTLLPVVALIVGILFVGSYIYFEEQKNEKKLRALYLQSQKNMRDACMQVADYDYSTFVELNGKKVSRKGEGVYEMPLLNGNMQIKQERKQKNHV